MIPQAYRLRFPAIDFAEVQGVLIDIDNTIYSYDYAHQFGLQAAEALFAAHYPDHAGTFRDRYNKNRKYWNQQLHGQASCHSRLLYFQRMLEQLTGRTQYELPLQLEEAYWGTLLEHMQPLPEAMDFLKSCRQKGLPVCAVTDLTAQIQLRKVVRLQLQDLLTFIVSSEEAGVEKPEPAIFHAALAKLQLKPDQVLMVGDSRHRDIEGATALGIRSFLVEVEKIQHEPN